MEYYFDIETSGLNPSKDKIVTFQYQALSMATGAPLTKLTIVKEWEDGCSEEMMLKLVMHLLIDAPLWSFVPIGNNLAFDFSFISARMRHYFGIDVLERLMDRPCIDVKHILVMINKGRFKNYAKIVGKGESGGNVPLWYQRKEYDKIVRYVEMEAEAFVRTYSILKRNLPLIITTS
jgi:uncharacterized protein YprB with RNaseH-like and TPR domain